MVLLVVDTVLSAKTVEISKLTLCPISSPNGHKIHISISADQSDNRLNSEIALRPVQT